MVLSLGIKVRLFGKVGEIPEKLSIVGGMFLISSIFFLKFGYKDYGGFTPFGPA